MSLEIFEEKWIRACRRKKAKWLAMVKKAESLDAYVKGISAITGIPEHVVRASFPAKGWAEFQANADKFVDIWISNIEKAFRLHKWSENYKKAYSATE